MNCPKCRFIALESDGRCPSCDTVFKPQTEQTEQTEEVDHTPRAFKLPRVDPEQERKKYAQAPTPQPTAQPTAAAAPALAPAPAPALAPIDGRMVPTLAQFANEAMVRGRVDLEKLRKLTTKCISDEFSIRDPMHVFDRVAAEYECFEPSEEPEEPEEKPVEDPDLLPIDKLPGYSVDKWCRRWGTGKRGRSAGPLTPDVFFRNKPGRKQWLIWRYKVTVDGQRKAYTAKFFALARFFAVQKRKNGQVGPEIDTYE